MKEEKYIQSLFEQAKKETPKLSYNEAAENFKTALAPSSPMDFIKDLFPNINLNIFTMITISSIIVSAIFWLNSPTPENNTAQPVTEITDNKKDESPDVFTNKKIKEELIPIKNTNLSKNENTAAKNQNAIDLSIIPDEKNDLFFTDELIIDNDKPVKIKSPDISTSPKPVNKKYDKTFSTKVKRDSIPSVPYTKPNFPTTEKRAPNGYKQSINKTKKNSWEKLSKPITQEFTMDQSRWTNIANEWGEIQIKTWDQNTVKFDILITVAADKLSKAQNILDNITTEFNNTRNGISAETIISKRKAINWNKRKNWEVSIDYLVYVPKNSNLQLYHYNGDVFVEEIYGAGHFDLTFSNIEIAGMGDHSKINIKSGKGKIGRSGNLETNLHFAELLAEEVGDLKIEASNSTIKTKKAKNIDCSSHWGKYKFGHIGNFKSLGNGDKIEIVTAKQLELTMTNGKITLDKAEDMEANFDFIQLEANELGEVEMDLQNSDLKIEKAGNVKGASVWGKLDLGDIKNYDNKSNGTNVEINSANDVTTHSANTKMELGTVSGDLDLYMHFGGCSAELLSNTPNIDLTGINANFDFQLPADAAFKFDINSDTNNFEISSDTPAVITTDKTTVNNKRGYFQNKKASNKIDADLTWGKLKLRVE